MDSSSRSNKISFRLIIILLAGGVRVRLYVEGKTQYATVSHQSGESRRFERLTDVVEYVKERSHESTTLGPEQIAERRTISSTNERIVRLSLLNIEKLFEDIQSVISKPNDNIPQFVDLLTEQVNRLDMVKVALTIVDTEFFPKCTQEQISLVLGNLDGTLCDLRRIIHVLATMIRLRDEVNIVHDIINHPQTPEYDTERIRRLRREIEEVSKIGMFITQPLAVVNYIRTFKDEIDLLYYDLAPCKFPYDDGELTYAPYPHFAMPRPLSKAADTLEEYEIRELILRGDNEEYISARRATIEAYFLDRGYLTREEIRETFKRAQTADWGPSYQDLVEESEIKL